jgi:hypothetical protein
MTSNQGLVWGTELSLTPDTTIHFATRAEGERLLSRPDRFLESLSRFDREIRVGKSSATEAELLAAIREDVVDWEAEELTRYRETLSALRPKLARFHIPWPERIWLVRTRGEMESGAAYCRQEAIVIPRRMDQKSPEELEHLLTHELFHVLSNQNPGLRPKLYGIVGFEPMEPLELPAPLADRKITNPDAPKIDCFLWVVHQGEVLPAAPLLLARSPFREDGPSSLFALLQFQLVALQPQQEPAAPDSPTLRSRRATGPSSRSESFQVLQREGEPLLLNPDRACLYWNIGINTNYIIHPEEVLADNFVYLIHDRPDLPTPRIVEQLRQLFE